MSKGIRGQLKIYLVIGIIFTFIGAACLIVELISGTTYPLMIGGSLALLIGVLSLFHYSTVKKAMDK